uniref:Uncharacterized protein n=1 Tax=Tanacetum cinerariifolium TaxID=118510 RepID=A0A699TJ60_TANCI|nr:hypothetical protein [Tanacetum cinerariifolium]
MRDDAGDGRVHRNQRLSEMHDVQVVDLFHQTMSEVGFVEQAIQAFMAVHDRWRCAEELLGDFQHGFDLAVDPGLQRHVVGGVQQIRNLFDISDHKTRQYTSGIDIGQMDGRVQMGKLRFELAQ